ncbi:MAG: hypothetical protein ABSF65_07930 [Candidatus Bathyarchaeia archaeon]|jgi:hypothetical protein
MTKTENPSDVNHDNLIGDLVQKIDNEKSLFNVLHELDVYGTTFSLVTLLIVAELVILALPNSFAPLLERITVFIGIIAIGFAYAGTLVADLKEIVVHANFKKAVKKFKINEKEEEKRLLLMALIKMKSMNHYSKLEIAKKMHKEMFTKEKLLERLYE